MPDAKDPELKILHDVVASRQETDQERALAALDRYRIMLEKLDVPRTHYYWNHFYYFGVDALYRYKKLQEALALAREGTAHDPKYAAAWHQRGDVAYDLGRMAESFHSYKIGLRLTKDVTKRVGRMVSILLDQKRYRMAARLGRAVVANDGLPISFRASMARVELGMRNGDAALAHLDAFEAGASKVTDSTRDLRRKIESLRAHQLRHVAIAGMSYVGSTLLGTLLGSLPGCAHVGETQELIYRANPKAYEFPIIDFENDPPAEIPQCRVCGASCAVFTKEFRAELARDPADWYFRIGRRVGARIVISSDKFLTEYSVREPLSRFDLIVLYKPLPVWVHSFQRVEAQRVANGIPSSPMATDLPRTLRYWADSYYAFLKELRPRGRRVVINWERFVERPHEHFEVLLKLLRLPGDAGVFETVKAPHYVGGNAGIASIVKEGRVQFRPSRGGETLSSMDEATVAGHEAAQMVFRMLESCYRTDFRACIA